MATSALPFDVDPASRDGEVTGVCTPLHRGRTMATYDIRIRDDHNHPVRTPRPTCLLRERPSD